MVGAVEKEKCFLGERASGVSWAEKKKGDGMEIALWEYRSCPPPNLPPTEAASAYSLALIVPPGDVGSRDPTRRAIHEDLGSIRLAKHPFYQLGAEVELGCVLDSVWR